MQLPIVEIGHPASNAAEKECLATHDQAEQGTWTLRGALTKGTPTVCHAPRFKLGQFSSNVVVPIISTISRPPSKKALDQP